MKVRVTFTARRDIDDIVNYLNERSPHAANSLMRDIEAAIEIIAAYPKARRLRQKPWFA